MAVVKYDHNSIVRAMEPGLASIIVSAFKTKLEDKINGIIEDIHKELQKELPEKVEASIKAVLLPEYDGVSIKVEINLEEE